MLDFISVPLSWNLSASLSYHIVRTQFAKVTASFSLFALSELLCTKKVSCPILFLTYLPQAYPPLEHYRLTDWQNSLPLVHLVIIFFTERVAYPQAQLYWAGRTMGWMAGRTSLPGLLCFQKCNTCFAWNAFYGPVDSNGTILGNKGITGQTKHSSFSPDQDAQGNALCAWIGSHIK